MVEQLKADEDNDRNDSSDDSSEDEKPKTGQPAMQTNQPTKWDFKMLK